MPNIPWNVIGAGGGFALLVLIIVFGFMVKMKKELTEQAKTRCCDSPEIVKQIQRTVFMSETVRSVHEEMRVQTKEMIKQTLLLKIMVRKTNGGVLDLDL